MYDLGFSLLTTFVSKVPTYEEAMGEPTIPPYQSQEYGFHSVIEQPTTMLLVTNLGPDSSYIFCPNCQQQVVTRVDYESGAMTWIFCAAITILTGPFGCCLIPFCIDGCKDVGHYCPVCDARIGSFRRI
ncbi:unnamed protein product [Calicophoron daubneyi]|uniref:LITAF domain-containing protein n=1 Tax=Calicophoron daubneyi TaxID=300641 RepID=A0AAV2TUY0_CALDB